MKKNYLKNYAKYFSTLFLMFGLVGNLAASNIEIGTGGTSTNTNYPIVSCYGYNYSQQIVLASEYNATGAAGNITAVRFFYDNGGTVIANWQDWDVYIGHTTKTSFASNTDWEPLASLTQVFTGTITAVSGTWIEVTFTTPFNYNGTDNLIVAVDENTPGYSCSAAWYSYNTALGENRGLVYRNDNTNPDPATPPTATFISSTIAQIQFEGVAASCAGPSSLASNVISTSEVDLDWTTGGATDWVVEYGAPGFVNGSGIVVSVTGTDSLNLTGLTASTNYEWYVRDFCNPDSSAWVGPNSFYTGHCVPSSTGTASFINDFTTANGATNISNLATGFTAGGYQDNYATHSLSVPASSSFDFSTVITGGSLGTAIWIDWNNDLTFDASERVFNTTTYSFDQTGTITVPAATPIGDYRMRVMVDYNSSSPIDPCRQGTRSEVEDYKLTVLAAPTCLSPTVTATNNVTNASADLLWETGGATEWIVQYGPAGFTLGAGIDSLVSINDSLNLTGLTANTSYDWYVRDFCTLGDSSVWVGPNNFNTLCDPYTIPYFEGFETAFPDQSILGGCLSQESIAGVQSWTANNSQTSNGRSPRTGSFSSYLRYGNTDWIYIPINLTAGISYTAQVFAKQDGTNTSNSDISISYGNAPNEAAMTNAIVGPVGIDNSYQLIFGAFTPATTGTFFVGIKGFMNGSPWYISLDDISIDVSPPCPGAPAALNAENVTAMTADLFFTNTGFATNWVLEWDTTGFTPGTGTEVQLTDTFTSVSGLIEQSVYQFYVRDYCGATDSSAWAGPFTFETPCGAVTPDYLEDFSSFPLNCWAPYVGGTQTTGPTAIASGNWFDSGFGNIGFSGSAGINIYGTGVFNDWLVSPTFDLSNGGYQLVFDVAGTEYADITPAAMGSDDTLALMKSTDGGMTWAFEKIWTQGSEPSPTGDRETFMLGADPATIFAFYGDNGSTSGGDNDLFIDNFRICTPVINNTPIASAFCSGDSLVLSDGTAVLLSGMVNDTLISVSGCDSVITYDVTVLVATTAIVDTTICQGTPLVLPNGTSVTVEGVYEEVYVNSVGCDSTVTYNVVINISTASTVAVHLCDGDTYTLPSGTVISAANTYLFTETNSIGCDSVVSFEVTTGMSTAETLPVSFCTGDSVMLADGTYAAVAGTMMVTTTNASGCDHVITYDVTENTVAMGASSETICAGDTMMFGSQMLTTDGVYTMSISSLNGCDSIVELTLTVLPLSSSTTNESICAGDSYPWDGAMLTDAGTYVLTTASVNGCDSVATLVLEVNAANDMTIDTSICAGDTYMFDGQALTMSGTYTENVTSASGCVSVNTLNLTVDALEESFSATICNGAVYTFGTQTLNAAGVYTDTITNANGCDVVVELTLEVTNAVSTTQNILLCDAIQDFVLANGTVVTEPGIYTAMVSNTTGCSDIITYNISTCVGLSNVENNIAIIAYPNPASDKLTIAFEERLSVDNTITISNLLGQKVYTKVNFENLSLEVNTSELTNGVYYINVRSANKTSVLPFTVAK